MAELSFEILGVEGGHVGFHVGYYRILVGSSSIKYLSFSGHRLQFPDIRGDLLALTTVPDGEWNVGYLIEESTDKKLRLESTGTIDLATIENIWCSSSVDWLELSNSKNLRGEADGELQCTTSMYAHVYPGHLGHEKVVVHYEWYPHDIYGVKHETEIYSLIDASGIAAKFVAHLTENHGRIIGFMTERVPGRLATPEDLPACQAVLAKLHSLGIAYASPGVLNYRSFIVCDDGVVLLQGFGGAYRTGDKTVFEKEMASVKSALEADRPNPTLSEELNDALMAICERDEGLHPAVVEQAFRDGTVTISEADHRAMLIQLREKRS